MELKARVNNFRNRLPFIPYNLLLFGKSIASQVSSLPMSYSVKHLIEQSVNQLNSILKTLVGSEMYRPSSQLPEYRTVMDFYGVGTILGSQLMTDTGDTRRLHNRKSITAFAWFDAHQFQSGALDIKSISISKRSSPSLRKTLFQIVSVILKTQPENNAVFNFINLLRVLPISG